MRPPEGDGPPPANVHDLVLRLISRATRSEVMLKRHLALLGGVRRTVVVVGSVVLLGLALLAAGIAAAVLLAGASPPTAVSIGATGAATAASTGAIAIYRRFRRPK